jgi:hypothetical protein
MKASEIFVEYASPIQEAVPADGNPKDLQKILSVPELVWNAIVMDENKNRKPGELPQILKKSMITVPPKNRAMMKATLKFWVARKDHMFANHNWPLVVTVYKNVKESLIIRVEVREPKTRAGNLPPEWLHPKPSAKILALK